MRQTRGRAGAFILLLLVSLCLAPAAYAQADPSVVGQWAAPFNWPAVPIHISLLPDGRLLFWGRDKGADGYDIIGQSTTYVWSPNYATTNLYDGPITAITPKPTTNLFCSGHSFLPDGRLLVTGGHGHPSKNGVGVPDTNIFDYRTNAWTRGPNMNKGRWYPFNVTLASGETLVVSGQWWDGTFVNGNPEVLNILVNNVPQVFTAQGTWRTLNTQQIEQPIYPWLHLMQDGRVFLSGYKQQSYYLNVTTEQWQAGPLSREVFRDTGSGVMYDMGRVLITGGGDPSSSGLSEAIDLTQASPFFRAAGQMIFPRRQMTAVLLPTGSVMVFGGTNTGGGFNRAAGAIYNPEMWSYQTETWSAMAPSASGIPRLYHSTAILLPDARVLVGGGGQPAASGEMAFGELCNDNPDASFNCRTFGHKDVEIFSPPYLFKAGGLPATRPTIASAPASITYNQTFAVGVGTVGATSIRKVTLVRLPSMTHSFSQDQRMNYLGFTVRADGVTLDVTAPNLARKCPPGYYMMFLINAAGTPSVAKIIRIS
jgi:Domain of unknown function (DUF1929)/Glyoxal oxidase N-terminus